VPLFEKVDLQYEIGCQSFDMVGNGRGYDHGFPISDDGAVICLIIVPHETDLAGQDAQSPPSAFLQPVLAQQAFGKTVAAERANRAINCCVIWQPETPLRSRYPAHLAAPLAMMMTAAAVPNRATAPGMTKICPYTALRSIGPHHV